MPPPPVDMRSEKLISASELEYDSDGFCEGRGWERRGGAVAGGTLEGGGCRKGKRGNTPRFPKFTSHGLCYTHLVQKVRFTVPFGFIPSYKN